MKKAGLFLTARASLAAGVPLLLLGLGLIVWQSVGLAAEARGLLRAAKAEEVYTAEAVAGFFLEAQPDDAARASAAALAAALKDADALAGYQAAGEEALARYGFGERGRAGYEAMEAGWLVRVIWISAAYVSAALLLLLYARVRRDARRGRIAEVLDAYLAGDYSFARGLGPLFGGRRAGGDGALSDSLRRLGGLIDWKNQTLVEEQERTKALVTDISHQLKTPIAALGTCFSLYLEAEDESEREEFLARSRLQMDKLEELTGALINISRMESAMIELSAAPTDLREMLLRAVNGVYDKSRKKGVAIELAPFDDVTLPLDERWTAEAIMNVLDNAVKYSPAGTAVRVSAETRKSFIRIEIADEGIGIPKELRPRVFQRFYRGAHPLVRASEGSGVGLYLTRMILEKQGGGVSVKSARGQGSVFVLQLRR